MTISKRDAKLLLILLGIIILLVAYLAVYNPYISKTEEVEAKISELKPILTELNGYFDNLNSYNVGTEEARQTIEDELDNYPEAVKPEDFVMYAIKLEDDVGLNINSISFSTTEPMRPFQLPQESGGGQYSLQDVTAYQSGMTISFSLDYQQFKKAIDYIAATKQRTALDTVSVSFNSEDGNLLGTATIKKYFVAGADVSYEETVVPNVPIGTDNLFGTFKVSAGS